MPSVGRQRVDVVVSVGRYEIERVFFPVAEPVFPTHVPAFDQYPIESVLSRKVDVAAYVGHIGPVLAPCRRPIGLPDVHFPPHPHKFMRFYSRRVLNGAGLVEVQYQLRGHDVGGPVAHDNRSPGRDSGCLQVRFVTYSIGGELRREGAGVLLSNSVTIDT
jgi:hypothetical protein